MKTKLSRKEFLKLAGLGAAGAALAACASQPTQAPAPIATEQTAAEPDAVQPTKASPPPEKQVVTFTMYGHPNMIEEMVPLFNDSHPNVEVKFERSEGQGYWEKLSASIAAGSSWDCFRGDQMRALGWGPKGVVADVKSFLDTDPTYPAAEYLDGILDVYQAEGRIYGLPTWCLTLWLYFNRRCCMDVECGKLGACHENTNPPPNKINLVWLRKPTHQS
jgi:multiple sugar transport system substrate-binding protein